ncbi:MAG: hypothetical protein RR903_11160, partial [Edwardsiella sp. (in: enterobacteria)]
VNKRLPVKLQKPYGASSGIVSIVAIRQSRRGDCADSIHDAKLTVFHHTWGRRRESQTCVLSVCDAHHKSHSRRAPATQFRPNDADLLLTVCYVGWHSISAQSYPFDAGRGT